MEVQKRKRKQKRREFTMAADELQKCIDDNSDILNTEVHFANFMETADSLFETEETLRNIWLEQVEFDEAAYEADQDRYSQYRKRYVTLRTCFEKLKRDLDMKSELSLSTTKRNNNQHGSENGDGSDSQRRFSLPRLELPKFDGNLKNWLQFWGQFRKIHEDKSLDDDDKFQYLLQSMCPNSSAKQLIESYPPCGDNYHKAIDALKTRFARDELLIECYVRGLQNLVLTQAKGQSLDIRALYDKLQTHLQALDTLGVTKDKYAAMLFPMVESALAEETLRAWNRNRLMEDQSIDELTKLLLFLRKEVESEERIEIARTGVASMGIMETRSPTMAFIATAASTSGTKASSQKTEKANGNCIWCDKVSHPSSECYNAAKMSIEERIDLVKKKKGCLICLKVGHWSKRCKSFPKCLYCKKRHLTLMCTKLSKDSESNTAGTSSSEKNQEVLMCKKENETLLQTILVELFNDRKKITVRALIDSGAQRSFIKKEAANKLALKPIGKEEMCHGVFGGSRTETKEHLIYAINVRSTDKKFTTEIMAIEEDMICGYIPKVPKCLISTLKQKGIVLTEATDDCLNDISLLIGADYCGLLMTGDVVQLQNNLTAVKTNLGWTIQGVTVGSCNNINMLLCTSKIEITDLWSLEAIGITDPAEQCSKAKYEQQILESFKRSIKVNDEGRYEVSLPWRDVPRPQTNYDLARKRLDSTTKRLAQLGKIEQYHVVFQEWMDMEIIEKAPTLGISGHYLPHHAVIKESSMTTKVRPVFDASARDKHGISLNACLEKGANLLELIPQLLIDFRKGAIGITADIAKAFLQIALRPEDREFLKFLWWSDPLSENKELITYRHKRVVFGVTSSPFHLSATIAYHLDNCPAMLGDTAMKLKKSYYVDNCVTSVDSIEAMNKFITESRELMRNGMFDLRCWVTGPERVDNSTRTISVLGIVWDTVDDTLSCNISSLKGLEGKLTRRNILSTTQKIFDPLGLFCPTTIIPKVLIQKSWVRRLSWDDELPADIAADFKSWLNVIHVTSEVKIPRRLTSASIAECDNTIHVFCDASRQAYAVCVFLRSQYGKNVKVSLVLAKARVTPVKVITIPRLELIAAVMGIRLYKHASEALGIKESKTYFWTDSSVTLSWIKGCGDWSVFVSNRIREIKNNSTVEQWNHVPGHLNPADLPSRGVNAKALLESRWWEGPSWLALDPDCWPATDFTIDSTTVNSELKKTPVNTLLATEECFLDRLNYFSSYTRVVRTLCWILRFRKRFTTYSSELSYDEVEYAEKVLIKLIQGKNYSRLLKNSKLLLSQDDDGILRLKTKLERSDEHNMEYKCPILLPGDELMVRRLLEERHKCLQHAGVQTLIANVREVFWIVGIRRLAKKVVNGCIKCNRYRVKSCQTPPVCLPLDRIKRGKAFEVTGIDLAGPLFLRCGQKVWVVLFTCAVYPAVHLELVTSLATDTFTMALRRFIARRGRVKVIYTDNGTNFVGTRNKLNTVNYEELMVQSTLLKIKWRFIPPGAPWWGGWWERLIGIMKDILRRILGRASLSYVELETVLGDVEAVMNQRPLTYVTGDTENLKPLTPAMFIQPLSSSEVLDLDYVDGKGLNLRFKYLQKLREDLQQRFRNEYLSALVQKGRAVSDGLKVGDIVLVENEGKRICWPLGLVVKVFDSVDGVCRVARVKTASGERVRPVQKLYPLEISATETLSRDTDAEQQRADINIPTKLDLNPELDAYPKPKMTRSGRIVTLPNRFH